MRPLQSCGHTQTHLTVVNTEWCGPTPSADEAVFPVKRREDAKLRARNTRRKRSGSFQTCLWWDWQMG